MTTQARSRVISSFGVVTPEQIDRLQQQTTRERAWYADIPSFEDNAQIEDAMQSRRLRHVTSTDNFRVIGRLCHRRTDIDQLPFTTHTCLAMIHTITDRWRIYANQAGIGPDVRLSLTSLVRTLSYQRALTGEDEPERGQPKLALTAAQSTHPKRMGGAVDFDRSGYYVGSGSNLTSVRLSGAKQHAVIRNELMARLGETPSPHIADPSLFNPDVPAALTAATEELHAEGLINRVLEFEGQLNECLHVAVNPDFLALI